MWGKASALQERRVCGDGASALRELRASGHPEISGRVAARAREAHPRTLYYPERVLEFANLDEAVDRHAREHLARAADGPADLQGRKYRGPTQADVLREAVRAEGAAARHLPVAKRSASLRPLQHHADLRADRGAVRLRPYQPDGDPVAARRAGVLVQRVLVSIAGYRPSRVQQHVLVSIVVDVHERDPVSLLQVPRARRVRHVQESAAAVVLEHDV